MRRTVWWLVALTACGSEATDGPTGSDAPTWEADIVPMLEAHCLACHADGGTGPFALTDIEKVRTFAVAALDAMDEEEMPPPTSDPECRDYVGSERLHLSDEDREVFAAWIEAGMPGGSGTLEPEAQPVPHLEQVDLEVRLEVPFRPTYPEAANEYRCFPLQHGQDETFFITGLEALIDQAPIVHHIVVFKEDAGAWEGVGPEGRDCFDDAGGIFEGMIGGWAPGAAPVELPEGYGLRVNPNERIVVQMHYYGGGPSTAELTDQSGFALRTASSVEHEVMMAPFGSYDFHIPAGEAAHTEGFAIEIPETIDLGGAELPMPDLEILGTFPHMHVLGAGYHLQVKRKEGGNECLARSEKYDFYNQLTYMFREPVVVHPGDTVRFDCTWDNSTDNPDRLLDPPQDVYYGERTDEEMCYAFTYVNIQW